MQMNTMNIKSMLDHFTYAQSHVTWLCACIEVSQVILYHWWYSFLELSKLSLSTKKRLLVLIN